MSRIALKFVFDPTVAGVCHCKPDTFKSMLWGQS